MLKSYAVGADNPYTDTSIIKDTAMNQGQRQNVLFVDDEESILEIFFEYFQHKNYQVFTARNGKEAVGILDRQPIDCCFTDINMPEMDGLKLAEHIHQTDNSIPVVIMTAYPSLENTIRTLKNGVVDFLIKPVDLSQMDLCIQRVLRERQLLIENVLLKKELEGKQRLEKLNQDLVAKVKELNQFNQIMGDFTRCTSSAAVFRRVIDLTLETADADEAQFYIVNDEDRGPTQVACNRRNPIADADGLAAQEAIPAPIIAEIATDQIPLLVADNKGARDLPLAIKSMMAVPMKIRDKAFGVLAACVTDGVTRFTEKQLYCLSFIAQNAGRTIENLALYENIYENLFSTLCAFVKALEARDPYTEQHSSRVTDIAMAIGKTIGLNMEEQDVLNIAGKLHDIGKLGIPDAILLKPGRLTDEEFEKIKEHPGIGAAIVGQLGQWERESQIIRCHHERFDGSGYPDGLAGEAIPLLSRILSVADAFDAMNSDRAYRRRMETEKILEIIHNGAGTQFDPRMVTVFLDLHHRGIVS